ncbi:hypothetical protein [Alistipes sp.]|uniref:hypothetical protein n=1 Tax=Alistipes sp. TaxID=1872444 RepID=UPI003AF16915
MSVQQGFRIEVASRYQEWWRYNVALMCGCFDAEDRRTGFATASSHVADVGSNLTERPADAQPDRCIVLETPPCDHVVLYVYIIPHTLPADNGIEASRPFDVTLTFYRDGKRLRTQTRAVNQWSGASLELRVPEKPGDGQHTTENVHH